MAMSADATTIVAPLRRRYYPLNGESNNAVDNPLVGIINRRSAGDTLMMGSPKRAEVYVNGSAGAGAGARGGGWGCKCKASFLKWTVRDAVYVARHHWIPCVFAFGLLFFMGVEYTHGMIPASSQPFDLGFVATRSLHRVLASWPELNTVLAALNTVFVGMQTGYILWTWLIEGRPRATISALFMFTFRGILGYSTRLPLPQEFLGSGVDFPVGNVSFFLFYSGHVASSVIASLDMRRMQRWGLAMLFDVLNVLQVIRLWGMRGHYTIDIAVGLGAGILFDSLAGKYEETSKRKLGLASSASLKDSLLS